MLLVSGMHYILLITGMYYNSLTAHVLYRPITRIYWGGGSQVGKVDLFAAGIVKTHLVKTYLVRWLIIPHWPWELQCLLVWPPFVFHAWANNAGLHVWHQLSAEQTWPGAWDKYIVYLPHSVMWPSCVWCPLVETGNSLAYEVLGLQLTILIFRLSSVIIRIL